MLSEKNYWRDEVLGCILFNIIVLPTLETVRDICWLANLPEISNTVRTTMKTKMATSPTIPAVSHSGFLKNSDKISQKINPQKSSKDFDVQNPEKNHQQRSHHAPPRIATHGHKFSTNPRVSHSSLCKSKNNFTKPMPPLDPSTSDLQNPGKSTPKVQPRAVTHRQNLSIHHGIILQICENLFKLSQN